MSPKAPSPQKKAATAAKAGALKPGPLLVLDGTYPSVGGGGAESQAGTLGRWFNANGYSCTLVTPMSTESPPITHETLDGLPVVRLVYPRIPLLGSLILQMRLAWLIWQRRNSISAVHAHICQWMAATCCLVCFVLDLPVYVKITGATELDGGFLDPKGGLSAKLKRQIFRLATGYQAISTEIAQAIVAVGMPRERILPIANAVDLTRFGLRRRDGNLKDKPPAGTDPLNTPPDAKDQAFSTTSPGPEFSDTIALTDLPGAIAAAVAAGERSAEGARPIAENGMSAREVLRGPVGRAVRQRLCPGAEFVVLFSGRLEPVKRLDMLLQAWADTLAHDKKAWLLIAGEGGQHKALEAQAKTSGIADRVVFLGHVDRIVEHIYAADVLALVSESEGLSNSMLEGMAGGLPVLGSRISGTEDFVTEGLTGWLFESGRLGSLSRQLAAARSTPADTLAQMSRAAHDEIVARASVQAVTRSLLDVYKRPRRKV